MNLLRCILMIGALFLPASAAQAAWLQAESTHFVVSSDGSEQDLRANVQLLEDYDSILRALTGAPAAAEAAKLHIYLVASDADLRKVRNYDGSIAGFYDATPEGIAAFAKRKVRDFAPDDVLLHEYAHHFMLQNFPANYPSWYIEGFAEYLATATFSDGHIEIGRANDARASWLRDTWLPLDRVLTSDSVPLTNGREVARFYAQSWLMVHYLMRDPDRRTKLQAYLRAFAQGQDAKAQFRTVFGLGAADFARQLRGYGQQMTFTRIPRASGARPAPIEVRKLPPSADDLLLFDAGLRLGIADWRSYPLLPRVRKAAARHPDDPLAIKTLARAELLYGDRTHAEALLDRLAKTAPGDRDMQYLRGFSHILAGRADSANRRAHFAKARPWLARAHKADGTFHPALIRYAESFSAEPDYRSENVGNILLLAAQIAPQVSLIRLNAAHQQAVRGDFKAAEALLGPVTTDPHSKRVKAAAQTLLTEVRAGRAPGPAFHVEQIEDE